MTNPQMAVALPHDAKELKRFTITSPDGEVPKGNAQRVRSEYVEEAWLPFIGPTALLLARRCDLALSTTPKSAVDVKSTAEALGVFPEEISAACHRLVRYGLATWSDRDPMLVLNRYWPEVPAAIMTSPHREALRRLPDLPATDER